MNNFPTKYGRSTAVFKDKMSIYEQREGLWCVRIDGSRRPDQMHISLVDASQGWRSASHQSALQDRRQLYAGGHPAALHTTGQALLQPPGPMLRRAGTAAGPAPRQCQLLRPAQALPLAPGRHLVPERPQPTPVLWRRASALALRCARRLGRIHCLPGRGYEGCADPFTAQPPQQQLTCGCAGNYYQDVMFRVAKFNATGGPVDIRFFVRERRLSSGLRALCSLTISRCLRSGHLRLPHRRDACARHGIQRQLADGQDVLWRAPRPAGVLGGNDGCRGRGWDCAV